MGINEHISENSFNEIKCPLGLEDCKVKGESPISCKYTEGRFHTKPCSPGYRVIKKCFVNKELKEREGLPNWDYKSHLDKSRERMMNNEKSK